MNLVDMAISDVGVASAILRKPRGGVVGLDVRELAGGAEALLAGPASFDVYCGAVDACLSRVRGLANHGYVLRRA